MKEVLIMLGMIMLGALLGFMAGYEDPHDGDYQRYVRRDTVMLRDTIRDTVPVVRDSVRVMWVTRWMQKVVDEGGQGPSTATAETGGEAQGTGAEDEEVVDDEEGDGQTWRPLGTGGEAPGTGAGGGQTWGALGTGADAPGTGAGGEELVEVYVPISQKMYEGDQYRAWVSGYEAKLDSILIYDQAMRIESYVKEKRRWGCVIGAGVGAGRHGVEPMVGVTVGWRLW